MKYVGLQTQIWRNNLRSLILLVLFPLVFFALVWLFFYFVPTEEVKTLNQVNHDFLRTIPWVTIAVVIWFIIAWFSHTSMIQRATGAKPLTRNENKRVYNLVENLCISKGMSLPKINIIEDDSLNAYASGINNKSYTVALSRGIIDKLDDDELEGVIAHELSHIRNRDVRLLIVSIVFVGIFAFIAESLLRSIRFGGRGGRGKNQGAGIAIAIGLALIGYLLATLFRFALSRKRESMADAGAAEMTKKPEALASALRKVSADPTIEAVERQDVAQMFIENPKLKAKSGFSFSSFFATHPPIKDRISVLEQF